jgi:hypothetical protein
MAEKLPYLMRTQEKMLVSPWVHTSVEKLHPPLIKAAKKTIKDNIPSNLITAPVVSHFQANIDTQIHNLFGALHVSGPMGGVGEHLFRFATTHITNLL